MGVDNAWLRHFARMFEERLSDARAFKNALQDSGLTRSDLSEPSKLIDPYKEGQFVRLACDHLKMPAFATIAGLDFNSPRDIVWYILKYSQNLREAIENASYYGALIDDTIGYSLVVSGNHASLQLQIVDGGLTKFHRRTEFLIFSAISLVRIITKTQLYPLEVRIQHVVKSAGPEIQKAAGCAISFGSERTEVILPLSSLDLPIPSYDPALKKHLTDYGDNLLKERVGRKSGIRNRVEALLLNELPGRIPNLQQVATDLGLSSRSLSRRLSEQGLKFRQIVDDIRCDLAQTYLKDGFTIGEIAFYLDFAGQAAFSTAFKRWTGLTPRQFQLQKT
ncbi:MULTISPECIES: AraC family transcriptional regulator [unclassified Ruegeria]|uniref:AraC family transcriptional regulator n=1 Tax=unclassified Ruegeria TaxID=2625375 RepID=UPI0014887B1B|nr:MULTISPECIES: AraC family transcriptional regulator [unclassified Ruegeria]NOE34895.1 helix-turn-helix domain-containing protein [Ruegeria sp. HKCCD7318]